MEDFESEQRKREVAHGKIADHQRKYAHDVGELKAQLAQMEEHLAQHQDRLAEVEQVNQRREKEMRSLLEEASKNQQEVQAKTSQVKQYKKQVDSLKEQVCLLLGMHIHVTYAYSVHHKMCQAVFPTSFRRNLVASNL